MTNLLNEGWVYRLGSIALKTLLGIVLALGLIVTSLPAVAAQDADVPTLPGFGDAITWTDESGNAIATVTVHGVDRDFRDYEEGWDPAFGYVYTLVDVSVVNDSEKAIILEAYPFLLIDDHGNRYNRLNLNSAGVETFDDDLALAPGESAEFSLAYAVPAHASVSLFAWNPESEQMHYVALSTDVNENSAIVWGVESTSVFTDDFGNPVATFQVTDINEDWTDYDDSSAPEDGGRYMAVTVAISNQTDRPVEVRHYDFKLANADGSQTQVTRVSVKDEADAPFRDRVQLQAGETTEVTMVFAVPAGTTPIAVIWALDYAKTNMVIIAQAPVSPAEATPDAVATPS